MNVVKRRVCRIKMLLSCLSLLFFFFFLYINFLYPLLFSVPNLFVPLTGVPWLSGLKLHTNSKTQNVSLTGLFPLSPSHLIFMKGNSINVPTPPPPPPHRVGFGGGGAPTHRSVYEYTQ